LSYLFLRIDILKTGMTHIKSKLDDWNNNEYLHTR